MAETTQMQVGSSPLHSIQMTLIPTMLNVITSSQVPMEPLSISQSWTLTFPMGMRDAYMTLWNLGMDLQKMHWSLANYVTTN